MSDNSALLIAQTADIVSAYVSNNTVPASEIPALINQVHSALMRVSRGHGGAPTEPLKPAISVKRSITPDYIVCLEDGKKFKSLKRHLRTQYNMTPEAYSEKWDLPPDYPMVAPNYAAARSQLAKQMGLGQQRRRRGEERSHCQAQVWRSSTRLIGSALPALGWRLETADAAATSTRNVLFLFLTTIPS